VSPGSPEPAPRRTDLPYLRHRRRPATAPADPAAAAVAAFVGGGGRRRSQSTADTPRHAGTAIGLPGTSPAVPAPGYMPRRTSTGAATVLTPRKPTVSLDRVQSGVGSVTVEAAWSDGHELRLGCAIRMRSGHSAVVPVDDVPKPDVPVALSTRGRHQSLALDLLRARHLDRLIVFAVLHRPLAPAWNGTLVVTTFGGTRIEVPVERAPGPGVAVLLSLYNVAGEMVLRAEREHVHGTLRDACSAYGFNWIAWLDGHTPLT
jgi:hypothetical protein